MREGRRVGNGASTRAGVTDAASRRTACGYRAARSTRAVFAAARRERISCHAPARRTPVRSVELDDLDPVRALARRCVLDARERAARIDRIYADLVRFL